MASLVGRQLTPKWHHDKKGLFLGTQKGNQDNDSMMDKELSRLSQRKGVQQDSVSGMSFLSELREFASDSPKCVNGN